MADRPQTVQTLNGQQIAQLCQKSNAWVSELRSKGFLPRSGKEGVHIVSVVRGVISYYESLLQQTAKKEAALEATRARTAEIEFRLAQRRKILIHEEDVRAAFIDFAAIVTAEIASIPAAYTRDLEQRRKLETLVNEARERIAARAEAESQALLFGGGDSETGPDRDAGGLGEAKPLLSRNKRNARAKKA